MERASRSRVTFICANPACRKSFGAPSTATKARCPYCNTVAEVPGAGQEPASLRDFSKQQFLKQVKQRAKRLWMSGAEFRPRCVVCTASIPELGGSVLEDAFLTSEPAYLDTLATHLKRLGWLKFRGRPNAHVRHKALDLIRERASSPYLMLCQACLSIIMDQLPSGARVAMPQTERLVESEEADDAEAASAKAAQAAARRSRSAKAATSSDMLTALEPPEGEGEADEEDPYRTAARRNSLGVSLGKQGNYAAAVREFQAAVDAVPKSASLHLNLGIALAHVDRDEDAVQHFRRTLELDPLNQKAHRCLKKVLKRLGKIEDSGKKS